MSDKKNKDKEPAFSPTSSDVKAPYGGTEAVIEMFKHLEDSHREKLLVEIQKKDPKLAQEITENLFTFEDFSYLDSKSLLLIYRSVNESTLALALRGGPDLLRDAFFNSLPARSAENLKDLVHSMGPQVLTSIKKAQKEIIQKAKELESEGKLLLKKTQG